MPVFGEKAQLEFIFNTPASPNTGVVGFCVSTHRAHPERLERPTPRFVVLYSIQLSYGCMWHTAERRERDSNPRNSFPLSALARQRFRPLSHLSPTIGSIPNWCWASSVIYLGWVDAQLSPRLLAKKMLSSAACSLKLSCADLISMPCVLRRCCWLLCNLVRCRFLIRRGRFRMNKKTSGISYLM